MTLPRLSPYNVTDVLFRGELYRDIRKGAEAQTSGWTEYEIEPDEMLRPELAAYRIYGTEELKWVVMVVTGLDNLRDQLPAGDTFWFPPVTWVRQRIKYWTDYEAKVGI